MAAPTLAEEEGVAAEGSELSLTLSSPLLLSLVVVVVTFSLLLSLLCVLNGSVE